MERRWDVSMVMKARLSWVEMTRRKGRPVDLDWWCRKSAKLKEKEIEDAEAIERYREEWIELVWAWMNWRCMNY